jgi:hypothetical protein
MITICPYCGHNLPHPIENGITGCTNCNRVFDSSPFHRLLCAAWLIRKKDISSPEYLQYLGFTVEESEMAITYVYDQCYNHEDFFQLLEEINVSKIYFRALATD